MCDCKLACLGAEDQKIMLPGSMQRGVPQAREPEGDRVVPAGRQAAADGI